MRILITYASGALPKGRRDAADLPSADLEAFTDHNGIANLKTEAREQLWIHRFAVTTAEGQLLHEQNLVSSDELSLGLPDPTRYAFVLEAEVAYAIPEERDAEAARSMLGTWRTDFVDDGIRYGRELSYLADGTFSGVLEQEGASYPIAGEWQIRNLVLTTSFDFNGQSERHSTRFEVSGSTMMTTGIPAGTTRQWIRQ
ncbi:MAG: hypothetical protein VX733_03930 [Candidatus Latescibacterota bacterium]|nr:hypothetical protein [Candidatus Latescibacterota bacterium]